MKNLFFPVLLFFFHYLPAQSHITAGFSDQHTLYALKLTLDSTDDLYYPDDIRILPDSKASLAYPLDSVKEIFAHNGFEIKDPADPKLWGNSFEVRDVNFDGNNDVMAYCTMDQNGDNPVFPYYFWLYNPANGKFELNAAFNTFADPEFDPVRKVITDRQEYMDSCVLRYFRVTDDIPVLEKKKTISPADFLVIDSIEMIIPRNDGLCDQQFEFTTDDHLNYFLPYMDADVMDGGFTIIPHFPFEKMVVTENYTLAYGAKVSETEGWLFYDSTFSDSVNKLTCFSYSPAKTLSSDGWFTYQAVSAPTSDIATGCPKPKVRFKTADQALRKRVPGFYAFVYDPNDYSDDSPQRKKQEESVHQTHLYYYYENITITIYSGGKKIEKVIHLYIRHGEC